MEISVSDILSLLSVGIDRKTLQRDLKELEKQLLISKKGVGKNTVYSLSEISNVLKKIKILKIKNNFLKKDIIYTPIRIYF